MESFEYFIKKVYDYFDKTKFNGALLQVTIKNYDQLCAISSKIEIEKIESATIAIIEDGIRKLGNNKIFCNGKFAYCFIDSCNVDDLSLCPAKIHDQLVIEKQYAIFSDIRAVGLRITENSDIAQSIRVLLDYQHYSEEYSIFEWIDNPDKYVEKLKNDYILLNELRTSIANQTACFAFQPVVNCKSGKIEYHEALLRLNNIDFRLISAGPYIMLAEKYGYITIVDKYVFEMAVSELKSAKNLKLSVNISNIGVQDKHLVEHILSVLDKTKVGPRIIFEITETAMNQNFEPTKYFVESVKKLGCKVALDDFGAGYNSFSQIRRFPIDVIKIDGSFIKDIATNQKNRALVDIIIKISEEMGCKTVAEFVENGEIAKKLIELKVDYMQGNFFSPALNYRSWDKD